ncbi:MAG: hypothetical protein GWN87_25950, partial [Desulfuromonadales bacterium]|nr:hypothetical protein [Desulfuromonadales bacterium]NIS43210.1 hypothetical protein [Desulfuromonadales bacterium]
MLNMNDMFTYGLFATIFLFVFFLVQLVYLVWREGHFSEKRRVKRRLMFISAGGKHGEEKLNLYRERVLKDVGVVEKFLLALPRISTLDRMLLRSNLPMTASFFVFMAFIIGLAGFVAGTQFMPTFSSAIIFGVFFFALPFIWLRFVESQALRRFDEQLPEALDLLARAIRSGHALSAG